LVIVVDFTPWKVGGTMAIHFDKHIFLNAVNQTTRLPCATKLTCKIPSGFADQETPSKTVETPGYLRNN